jgi:hypothetical protein
MNRLSSIDINKHVLETIRNVETDFYTVYMDHIFTPDSRQLMSQILANYCAKLDTNTVHNINANLKSIMTNLESIYTDAGGTFPIDADLFRKIINKSNFSSMLPPPIQSTIIKPLQITPFKVTTGIQIQNLLPSTFRLNVPVGTVPVHMPAGTQSQVVTGSPAVHVNIPIKAIQVHTGLGAKSPAPAPTDPSQPTIATLVNHAKPQSPLRLAIPPTVTVGQPQTLLKINIPPTVIVGQPQIVLKTTTSPTITKFQTLFTTTPTLPPQTPGVATPLFTTQTPAIATPTVPPQTPAIATPTVPPQTPITTTPLFTTRPPIVTPQFVDKTQHNNDNVYLMMDTNYQKMDIKRTTVFTAPYPTGGHIVLDRYIGFILSFWKSIQLPINNGAPVDRPTIHPDVQDCLGEYLMKEDASLYPCKDLIEFTAAFKTTCEPNGWKLEDTSTLDQSTNQLVQPASVLMARTNFLTVILVTFLGRSFFECIKHKKNLRLMTMYRSISGIVQPENFDTSILTWKDPMYPKDFEIPPQIFIGADARISSENHSFSRSNPFIQSLIEDFLVRKETQIFFGENIVSIRLSLLCVLEWFNFMFTSGVYNSVDYTSTKQQYVEYAAQLGLDTTHGAKVEQLDQDKQDAIVSRVLSNNPDVTPEDIVSTDIDTLYKFKNISIERYIADDPTWINWVESLAPEINALLVNIVETIFEGQTGEVTFLKYMTWFRSSAFGDFYKRMYNIDVYT